MSVTIKNVRAMLKDRKVAMLQLAAIELTIESQKYSHNITAMHMKRGF